MNLHSCPAGLENVYASSPPSGCSMATSCSLRAGHGQPCFKKEPLSKISVPQLKAPLVEMRHARCAAPFKSSGKRKKRRIPSLSSSRPPNSRPHYSLAWLYHAHNQAHSCPSLLATWIILHRIRMRPLLRHHDVWRDFSTSDATSCVMILPFVPFPPLPPSSIGKLGYISQGDQARERNWTESSSRYRISNV